MKHSMSIKAAYDNLIEHHVFAEEMAIYNANRSEHLSSTALKLMINESAADYKYKNDNPSNEVKLAYILGNAVHSMVLEGMIKYNKSFVVGGPKGSDGKEVGIGSDRFKIKRQAVNENGQELITSELHNTARKMRESCLKHPLVKAILSEGVSERVLRTEYMGINCQVRFDRLSPLWGIPDLKTTKDLRFFVKDARWKYGYYIQAALYQSLAYHVAPEFGYLPFCFMVVESKPPYKVGVFEMDAELMERSRYEVMDALIALKECKETDFWPTNYEKLQQITY